MSPWQYVLILLALVILISYPIWRRFVVGKANELGANAGKSMVAKRLPGLLDELATTLDLQTDVATATEVINQAVAAKPKKATAIAPGLWHLAFSSSDDVHARLTQTESGARLAVVKTIEFMDYPQGGQDWKAFRGRVVEAAQARGVATSEGTSPHLVRAQNPQGDAQSLANAEHMWVAPTT